MLPFSGGHVDPIDGLKIRGLLDEAVSGPECQAVTDRETTLRLRLTASVTLLGAAHVRLVHLDPPRESVSLSQNPLPLVATGVNRIAKYENRGRNPIMRVTSA